MNVYMIKNIDERLVNVIKKVCRLEVDDNYINKLIIDSDCDLMDELGFDSFLMVQLIVDIEDEFNIEIDMEELDIFILKKYKGLKEYVVKNLGVDNGN